MSHLWTAFGLMALGVLTGAACAYRTLFTRDSSLRYIDDPTPRAVRTLCVFSLLALAASVVFAMAALLGD